MGRIVVALLAVVAFITLTSGLCPRSLSTNFAANHHHHRTGKGKGQTQDNAGLYKSGTVYKLNRIGRQAVTCNSGDVYRTADGTCNNVNNPTWGSVGQTYLRLLDPVYDDGVKLPRMKKVDGSDLPSPRSVSTRVHDFDRNRFSRESVMLMEWGQFLAHDLVGTPVDDEELEEDCCYDDLVTGSEKHPHVATGGPCFPIIISAGDRYFTNVSTRCMEFVRSQPVTDSSGVRQQKNVLSAFIDGTNVYGVDETAMNNLRSFSGGKLKVKNAEFLPESSVNECIKSADTDYCLEAGDSRVNVYPPLGAMHTIFMRYHNYVADQLAANHNDYDDEKLFQESRKIVIAALQRITYNEYLRRLLGSNTMNAYGLLDDWTYNASCDATLSNVFATAAFRFGHSMVPDNLLINGVRYNSVDLYKRPFHVLSNLDSLVQGMVSEPAEKADRWYSEGITDQLFETEPQNGYDIASLNIQRGRDHGLPDYNKWRHFCGLGNITDFSQMTSSRRYQLAYGDVNDVDLYSGALSETGGTVGPTYQCLIAQQFQRLRNCDRFWWETTDASIGFADNRVRRQVQRIRLSHIICLTTGIQQIQSNVFIVPGQTSLDSCEDLLATSTDYSVF